MFATFSPFGGTLGKVMRQYPCEESIYTVVLGNVCTPVFRMTMLLGNFVMLMGKPMHARTNEVNNLEAYFFVGAQRVKWSSRAAVGW